MTDAAHSTLPTAALIASRRNSPANAALVKRRYAAERRFKACGIGALILTGTFLVALLTNIVAKSIPAFFEHTANLEVKLDPEILTPNGKTDADTLRAADYASLTRTALMNVVPGVEGRAARRSLSGILSSGAADEVRRRVVADPTLVSQTITVPLLLSDDADLYMKGQNAGVSTIPGVGTVTPSDVKGSITLTSTDAAFKPLVEELTKSGISKDADTGAITLNSAIPSRLVVINRGLVKLETVTPESASGSVLLSLKGNEAAVGPAWQQTTYSVPEGRRKTNDQDVAIIEKLKDTGAIRKGINWRFFTSGDSREPELAGIRGALVGSALTLLVTLVLCLPIGVLAAVYLEEFAPKNRLTDIIEVNINNLAAVPSIVFGLLGLAVFLNFMGLPRSAPLVGGLVLALLVLPTIIIAARAAIKAVPPSIREAAIGLGASHQQAVFHHVLPLAMPGIMTGTIIGMAHALGETAPLLMIGMIAFIVDIPSALTQAATVLPVQIYLWSDLPEAAFQQRTAAAIVVLLAFLFAMNGAAIWLRSKFERRW